MSKIGSFIIGAAVGAAAALLLAPQAGEKTRALVAEKANAVAGEAKDFGAGFPQSAQDMLKVAQEKGASFAKDATSKGQGFVADAQARVKEVTGQPAEIDSDDLREKIEAARQRIAAQVMENAEQSKALDVDAAKEAAAEVVEEAAEAVEEAAEAVAEAAEEAK